MKLRNTTVEDVDFLYRLHRAAMKEYVMHTWGWDEAWQQNHFRQQFNPSACHIISVEGKDIGVVMVEEKETELYVSVVEIMPEYQKMGIGTRVVQMVLKEAQTKDKAVALQVLKVNPAKKLYERLGFHVTGETATHYHMRVDAIV